MGSHQTITVPANSSNDYPMKNDEWSVKVSIDKIDSETKQRIKGDAEFKLFEWDVVRQCYIPFGGYNQYKVERQADGTYKVINHSDYAGGSDSIYYTQRNEGKFVIVESRAPSGYYGDWTNVTKPGTAGSVLGKRAYAFEITKALDCQTIRLGNADHNADITMTNSGGTLIDTGEGIVTITFGIRNADKTYATDPTGIANNEDSYTMHANADKMQNDRVLGNILLTKVDLDAARYLAAGSNGDTTLEGAVYDLYAADTLEHPDGVSGVVDYSKITDANGQPIWHTTVLTNGGWDTDYLPILQKDRLVASAKITDGKLAFANLYMGRYYLVERATGLVLPIDGNGKLYVTGKYPLLNKKLERTGKYSDLARKNNEYTDYIYKNQYSAVAESRKLNGSKAWDGYYLSYAKGYLCDEVNHYKTLSYADESAYHIHAEQESQDEVLKSGFSLQKLVSTTGQPSPALKLEGAGFTVYRIFKLSKATQFKQNPDGSYDAASILSAYRKDNYDNATLKYDFTHAPVLDIDKTDIACNLLPGATLTIRDADGEAIDTWVTDYKTHRVPISDEFIKLSGEAKEYIYTLTEDAAPAGFEIANSVQFKLETVDDGISLFVRENVDAEWVRADKRLIQMIDETTPREDTPTPTPAPTPQPTPAATPVPTPAPTPVIAPRKVQTLPQTGDGFPLLAIVVVSLASATGIVLLTVKQRNALKETSDKEDADESSDR